MAASRARSCARLWQALQVELHGQYSVPRLLEFQRYFDRSSTARVLAVALATPLPCLANIVAFDLIPLSPPGAGLVANGVFWTRVFGFSCISTLANIALHQRAMGLPPIRAAHAAAIVVVVNTITTLLCIGLAVAIGFPVPFLALVSGVPWMIVFHACLALVWGSHIRQNPRVVDCYREYSSILSIQGGMMVVYPVYYYFYQQLRSLEQAAFSLLLPAVKIGIKNLMSRRFLLHSDLRPEETVFTIEIFSALFVTFSMQNSASLLPAAILSTVDIVHACVSVYDMHQLATQLTRTRTRMRILAAAKGDPLRSAASLKLAVERSSEALGTRAWLAGVVHEAAALVSQFDPASRTRVDVAASRLSIAAPRAAQKVMQSVSLSRERNQVVPVSLSQTRRSSSADCQLAQEQELFVAQVLRFLHTSEFVVLIEFTEVVIPMIYLVYLSVIMQLDNRQYYPQLTSLDSAQFLRLVANVAIYALLELLSLLLIHYIVWRKLRFSLFAQLGFVLETRWRTVQAKLVLWVLYIVQTMLVHYGADYSFQFEWLHERPKPSSSATS